MLCVIYFKMVQHREKANMAKSSNYWTTCRWLILVVYCIFLSTLLLFWLMQSEGRDYWKIPDCTGQVCLSLTLISKLLHSLGNHRQTHVSDSGAAWVKSDLVKGFKDVERRKWAQTATSESIVISLNPLICTNTVGLQVCSTRSSLMQC